MPTAKLQNAEVFYDIHGQGEQPLILVHGLAVDANVWLRLIPYLSKNFKIIRLDLRGCGRTQFNGEPFTVDDVSDDIVQLMDYLHIQKAAIMGHSMGGGVVQNFAARYSDKVSHLVILNARYKLNLAIGRFWQGVAHLRENYQIAAEDLAGITLPLVYSRHFLAQEGNLPAMQELAKNNPYPQTLQNFRLQLASMKGFDGLAYAPKLTMKTLIINGSEDMLAGPHEMQDFAKMLPQAKFMVQEGGAHCPMIETPEWLAEQVRNFLGVE